MLLKIVPNLLYLGNLGHKYIFDSFLYLGYNIFDA